MRRQHAWGAAFAAIASSAFFAISGQSDDLSPNVTLPAAEAPIVRLLAPEPDTDKLEAPRPTNSSTPPATSLPRGAATANRPLGLGFPGGRPNPASPSRPKASHPRRSTNEILPVQGTDSDSGPVEIPVTPSESLTPLSRPLDSDDPPPPSRSPRQESDDEPQPGSSDRTLTPVDPEMGVAESPPPLTRHTSSELYEAAGLAPPYLPANSDPDALPWTAPYEDRAARTPVVEEIDPVSQDLTAIPVGYVPWWVHELPQSIRPKQTPVPVDIDSLVTGALQFSPQILSVRTQPEINQNILLAEDAAFDWAAFVESKWSDLNDPVGNTLTTGNNSDRFIDQIATVDAGVRRRTRSGGEFEASQKFGWQDNNSTFFIPAPQGTTRLQLNYTQPLLQGSGEAYNQSRIVLAQIELNRSFDVVHEELQNHLVKVAEAYWDLYRSRAVYLQRQRVYQRAEIILSTLDGRGEIDALQRQINRAKAAVASRRSEIIRAQSAIRNAESRLRLLVNDPQFHDLSEIELVPIESPRGEHVPLSLAGSLQQALQYRPDISQAVHDLRAAGVRLGVSQNELLPKLDLVLSAYVAGLEGDHDILGAWGDQFSAGRPGYTAGAVFEMPFGNRAAKSRQNRRQWELTKTVYDFRTTVEMGLTEVELSIREAETSYREMLGKFQSLVAAETESSYLEDRWKILPGGDRGTTLLLEDLLDAQQREADAEGELVQSQVAYSLAILRARRAMGTLIIAQNPTRYESVDILPHGTSEEASPTETVPTETGPSETGPTEPTPAETPISTSTRSRKTILGSLSQASGKSSSTTQRESSEDLDEDPDTESSRQAHKKQPSGTNSKQTLNIRKLWSNR